MKSKKAKLGEVGFIDGMVYKSKKELKNYLREESIKEDVKYD